MPRFEIPCDDDELARWKQRASQLGLPTAAYARLVLNLVSDDEINFRLVRRNPNEIVVMAPERKQKPRNRSGKNKYTD